MSDGTSPVMSEDKTGVYLLREGVFIYTRTIYESMFTKILASRFQL